MATREQIFTALLAHLQTTAGFVTFSRRFVHPNDIPASLQPALIVREMDESSDDEGGPLQKRTLAAWVYIYCKVPVPPSVETSSAGLALAPGATTLNPLIEAVEAKLAPDSSGVGFVQGKLTLGGLVHEISRRGPLLKETGDTDSGGQAFACFELNILVP